MTMTGLAEWSCPFLQCIFSILPQVEIFAFKYHTLKMPQHSSKKKEPHDINELAFDVVRSLTSDEPPDEEEEQKNPHAVALGRLGGLVGGKARAEKLSPK